ncbi:hypothetical protein BJ322DRAFT_1069954, partial [Thelephora terrestris]
MNGRRRYPAHRQDGAETTIPPKVLTMFILFYFIFLPLPLAGGWASFSAPDLRHFSLFPRLVFADLCIPTFPPGITGLLSVYLGGMVIVPLAQLVRWATLATSEPWESFTRWWLRIKGPPRSCTLDAIQTKTDHVES